MRNVMPQVIVGVLVVGGCLPAYGYLPFQKEWVKMYVDAEETSEENQEFVKLVTHGRTKCLVCHQGKKKKHLNDYGNQFVGLLTKEDNKDTDKIIASLEKVGVLPIDPEMDPDNEDAVTYNDLIARKEFPGGELEDLQVEPLVEQDDGEPTDQDLE